MKRVFWALKFIYLKASTDERGKWFKCVFSSLDDVDRKNGVGKDSGSSIFELRANDYFIVFIPLSVIIINSKVFKYVFYSVGMFPTVQ